MNLNLFRATTIAGLLLLSACATIPDAPKHVSLLDSTRSKITSTELVIPPSGTALRVDLAPTIDTSLDGGGLVGPLGDILYAAFDGVRDANAQADAKSLQDAMSGFDFNEKLSRELTSSLTQATWLHLDKTRVLKDASAAAMEKALAESPSNTVLFTVTDYYLSQTGGALWIELHASLFARGDALAALKPANDTGAKAAASNALYREIFQYNLALPGATRNRPSNIAKWSANNGALMRTSLSKGAATLARMLADDLQASGPDKTGITDQPDGILYRGPDGALSFTGR